MESQIRSQLYKDIRGLMAKYGMADMGSIDVAEVLQDLMDVMKENKITMPHGLTMLARGLAHVEGVLADISPQINMVEIAASRLKSQFIQNHDWKKEVKSGAKSIYLSMRKSSGYSGSCGRSFRRLHERSDEDQSGSACRRRPGEFVAPRHEKCGHGSLGHGTTY